jgi:hypothetical protein
MALPYSRCGISTIQLEGTVNDWREIGRRVQVFRDWGLDWWIDSLEPILAQFVAAAEDSIDRAFWESIYKWNGPQGSGDSPYVSGWALNFFPYLNNCAAKWVQRSGKASDAPSVLRNPWLGSARNHKGPGRADFPCLPSKAPFKWFYLDKTFDMSFVGGLIGMRQEEETLFLRPEIGWAVLDASDWHLS